MKVNLAKGRYQSVLVCYSVIISMEYSLNNVYVKKALVIGSDKGVKQLFFAQHGDGKFEIRGDLDKLSVLNRLEMEINREEALKCQWLVKKDPKFPKLPRSMEFVLKQPRLVKSATISVINHLMTSAGVKLGRDKFPAWNFPLDKCMLVHTSSLVTSMPDIFSLSDIIEWSALQGTSISNGKIGALKVVILSNFSRTIYLTTFLGCKWHH